MISLTSLFDEIPLKKDPTVSLFNYKSCEQLSTIDIW